MSQSSGEQDRHYPDGLPLSQQARWRQDFPTDIPEDDLVARREFIKFMVLTSGAFAAGQCWIGVSSLVKHSGPWPEKRIAVAAEVPAGGVVEFRYPDEDEPCLLLRLKGGRLVAYGQKCSHLSCAVIPEMDKGELHCPCHNGHFEIGEGRPIAGPPRRPLPRVLLTIRDGVIYAVGMERRTT